MKEKKYLIYICIKEENILVGYFYVNFLRGKETYSFQYADSYLSKKVNYILDPEISLISGRQYKQDSTRMYGFLSDLCPDRWGRILIKKSLKDKTTIKETDYLTCVSDRTRNGAIRIKEENKDEFLSSSEEEIPSTLFLNRLIQESLNFEENNDIELKHLIFPGSSLGGARPKANVYDKANDLYIAKFPSKKDEYDVELYEKLALDLAQKCGINVPDNYIYKFSDYGHTLLVKRFDRVKNKRIPYSSMMTLLGGNDGESENYSYLDLLGIIFNHSCNPKEDSKELFKRLLFNILIHNCDDHLRNHAMILTDGGWRLSPVFDINPDFYGKSLSLSIDGNDYSLNLQTALKTCKYYGLSNQEAERMLSNMLEVFKKDLPLLSRKYGIDLPFEF